MPDGVSSASMVRLGHLGGPIAALAATLAAGCNSILGIGVPATGPTDAAASDAAPGDATSDAAPGDAAIDAPMIDAPPSAVTGGITSGASACNGTVCVKATFEIGGACNGTVCVNGGIAP